MGIDLELVPELTGRRAGRRVDGRRVPADLPGHPVVTRAIRSGRGPFQDASVGGVHLHHEVYGIFLLLGTGTAVLTYRPDRPGARVVAVLFGAGAALTLDEFALWLHLEDVYWSREGRSSVDAVLIALVVGCCCSSGRTRSTPTRRRARLPRLHRRW